MLRHPVPEIATWTTVWLALTTMAAWPAKKKHVMAPMPSRLRVPHGGLALAAILIFLGFHIVNHLFGLVSADAHLAVMKFGRHWYRASLVEPMLVTVMLLLVATGAALLWRRMAEPTDFFQTLQAASGAYLLFFVLGHMNSVFVFARSWLRIDTDWSFATGAPAGLISDAWNIRLVPHYWFGVFFLLVHLVGGARIVLIAHGGLPRTGNRLVIAGSAFAALIACAILLGMCGVHFG